MYNIINLDEFPTVHGKIIIPKNTILSRGYDSNYRGAPILSKVWHSTVCLN